MTNRKGLFLSGLGILLALLLFRAAKPVVADNIIAVTTISDGVDDGDALCSLREAVIAANKNTGGGLAGECSAGSATETDVIELQAGLTYNLTIGGVDTDDDAAVGDLDIVDNPDAEMDLIIQTVGAGDSAIVDTNGGRIWHIHEAGFTLENVETTGGFNVDGGGLYNNGGNVVLEESNFNLNTALNAGGAIYNNGVGASLQLTATMVINNEANLGEGAGIYNVDGTVVAVDSIISSNVADGGGGLYNENGIVTLTRVHISGNEASGCGGGVANTGTGVVTLIDSAIANNEAGSGGGLCNEATMSVTEESSIDSNIASDGGGIYNSGDLTIDNSSVNDNDAQNSDGGGIYNSGDLTIDNNSLISGNEAESGGNSDNGGGVYNSGNVTIQNSLIDANIADFGGGLHNDGGNTNLEDVNFTGNLGTMGGGIYSNGIDAQVQLTTTTIISNAAFMAGGGIFNDTGLLTAVDSTITGNTSNSGGGGLYNEDGNVTLTQTTFSGNNTVECGGAIANDSTGNLTLVKSDIIGTNKSDQFGGGLCNRGTMNITDGTLVSMNKADGNGGGIYDAGGDLTIRNSRIENNKALGINIDTGLGGGVYTVASSSVDMRQSAIVGNESALIGGGVVVQGTWLVFNSTVSGNSSELVGGMYVVDTNGHATLINVTMADNEATNGAGVSGLYVVDGTAVIGNSIIASTAQVTATCSDNNGTITSLGYNIGDDDTCFGEVTDFINMDPMLEPLVDGVQSPQAGSPAIDAADSIMCSETAVASTDQVGQSRPVFDGCDIGAIEWTGAQVFLPVIMR